MSFNWLLFFLIGNSTLLFLSLLFYFYHFFWRWLSQKKLVRNQKVTLFQDHILLGDGSKLIAHYQLFSNQKPLFVFVHGLGAHLHETAWLEDFFLQNHYSYLNYSRRYSGTNFTAPWDKHDFRHEIDDCQEILLALHQANPEKKIIALGHSLGAMLLAKTLLSPQIQKLPISFALFNLPTGTTYLRKLLNKNPLSLFFSDKTLFTFKFVVPSFYPAFVYCSSRCNNERYQKLFNYCQQFSDQPLKITHYFQANNFYFRKIPLYYFFTLWFIYGRFLSKIPQNQTNQIFLFQGEQDPFYDPRKFKFQTKTWTKANNLHKIYLPNFAHRFFEDDQTNQTFWKTKILPHLLEQ